MRRKLAKGRQYTCIFEVLSFTAEIINHKNQANDMDGFVIKI